MTIVPVILCGGSGTRLWPLSRENFPKQFISLLGQASLFQQTLQRLKGIHNLGPVLVVGNDEHRFLMQEQLRQINLQAELLILEPEARNTAPAMTQAALWAEAHVPDAVLLVMPSDHVIMRPEGLHALMAEATALAESGRIVTFGVTPERPETGYGYIQVDGTQVLAFKEKPTLEVAASYYAAGNYLWNAGMFACQPQTWLKELAHYEPELLEHSRLAFAAGQMDGRFFRPEPAAFGQIPARSIDYAVMEHTQLAAVLPLEAGWSDVGAWSALREVSSLDPDGNVCEGDVLSHASQNNYLKSSSRLVAALGVKDLIVVETADAVLVASQDYAQEVKHVVAQLKAASRSEADNHLKVARPWGYYETVDRGERFQVKRITVHAGHSLSLQMHHHRAEHWVVVKGTAKVTRNQETFLLGENESVYIPLGATHRLENPGSIDLELIEIQSGSYLGEDDIVRFEDKYQRS